jgi:hypothetical protein
MSSRRGLLRLLAFALVGIPAAAAYVLSGLTRPINFHDEGFPVYAALRILAGDVPYRDFWTIHTPGQWYSLAALFKVFGPSLLAERIWDSLVRVLFLFTLYGFASRLSSPRVALAPGLVILVYLGTTPFYAYMMFPALLLGALSGLCLLIHAEAPRAHWLALGGLCAGLAALYRHDVGFYAAVAGGAVLAARAVTPPAPGAEGASPARLRRLASLLGPYAAGVVVVVGPAAAALLAVVPLGLLWDQLFVYPSRLAGSLRSLPMPPLWINPHLAFEGEEHLKAYVSWVFESWIQTYFPLITYAFGAAAALAFLRRAARGHGRAPAGWGAMWLTLFGALLYLKVVMRTDAIHLMPTSLMAMVLFTALADRAWKTAGRGPALAALCVVLPLLSISLFWMPAMDWVARTAQGWPPSCSVPLERARCMPLRRDEAAVIELVQALVPPGERIFVGNARHDRTYITDVLFYFVSGRYSATRYFSLEPGVATTEAVQKEIIQELQRHRVRVIVLYSPARPVIEPNESGESSGVTLLDDYIRSAYRKGWVSGEYSVWEKR